jgi:pilus assembly protein CpaE
MDRQMAIDAGADDFLSKPITREDLMQHLSQLLASGAKAVPRPLEPRVEPLPVEPVEPVEIAEPQAAMPAQDVPITDIFVEDAPITLPVIAVMSLRGGSGATTVAINLALGVMQHGRSCIVDLADAPGHVAVQLQLAPSTTWLNLVNAGPQPDPNQIGASLIMHPSAGVAVMAAPATYTTERPSTQTLRHVFQVLSEGFKRVVVDLPAKIDPTSEAVLRIASHVVLVGGDDLTVLQTAGESFRAIEALNLNAQLHVVLNRTRPGGVSFEEAQLALGREIEVELPYEPDQTAATAQGQPLVMSSPASLFSQNILHLARML